MRLYLLHQQVEAIHQTQRFEFVFGQRARNTAGDLVTKLVIAGSDKGAVKICVVIHWKSLPVCRENSWKGRAGGTLRGNGLAYDLRSHP